MLIKKINHQQKWRQALKTIKPLGVEKKVISKSTYGQHTFLVTLLEQPSNAVGLYDQNKERSPDAPDSQRILRVKPRNNPTGPSRTPALTFPHVQMRK